MADVLVDFFASAERCNGNVGVLGDVGAAVVPSRVGNGSATGLLRGSED